MAASEFLPWCNEVIEGSYVIATCMHCGNVTKEFIPMAEGLVFCPNCHYGYGEFLEHHNAYFNRQLSKEVHALKIDDSFEHVSNYIYLHGAVEKMNGFDCVYIEDMPDVAGKYNCKVKLADRDDTISAVLFYWTVPFGKVSEVAVFGGLEGSGLHIDIDNPEMLIKDRGLIVAINDTEHLLDAERKFNERQEYL